MFRSSPKLSESKVYEEAGFSANYNNNPIYIAREAKQMILSESE